MRLQESRAAVWKSLENSQRAAGMHWSIFEDKTYQSISFSGDRSAPHVILTKRHACIHIKRGLKMNTYMKQHLRKDFGLQDVGNSTKVIGRDAS